MNFILAIFQKTQPKAVKGKAKLYPKESTF
jgi:hypothetical protein